MSSIRSAGVRRTRAGRSILLCAWLLLSGPIGAASAQQGPSPPPAPPAAADAPPPASAPPNPPAETAPVQPSLADKLGEILKQSVDDMSSRLKGTQQSIEDMNKSIQDMNKGTVDTLTRLPVTGFVNGRALCTRADNGAPDCRAASDKMCREKGFKSGSSVEIQAAENCSARVFIPGYQRKDGDCRTDNYVTRAACN